MHHMHVFMSLPFTRLPHRKCRHIQEDTDTPPHHAPEHRCERPRPQPACSPHPTWHTQREIHSFLQLLNVDEGADGKWKISLHSVCIGTGVSLFGKNWPVEGAHVFLTGRCPQEHTLDVVECGVKVSLTDSQTWRLMLETFWKKIYPPLGRRHPHNRPAVNQTQTTALTDNNVCQSLSLSHFSLQVLKSYMKKSTVSHNVTYWDK